MKKIISFCLFFATASTLLAQNETYDLVEFTPPKNWKKEVTETTMNFTVTNSNTGGWCQIFIIKSTASKGSLSQDFDSEWQGLIVKNYQPSGAPEIQELPDKDGYQMKMGSAHFTFAEKDAVAMLFTISGFDRCISIAMITNVTDYFDDFKEFMNLVSFKKPEAPVPVKPQAESAEVNILGIWTKRSSMHVKEGDPYSQFDAGYRVDQYEFNTDGTYNFYTKVFKSTLKQILFVRENGTYQFDGNMLTINPVKSAMETWSKGTKFENGKNSVTDKFDKLTSTQPRPLEKMTYRLTHHYFSGIDEWDLILQSDKQTMRDGAYASNDAFKNAWFYCRVTENKPAIDMPGGKTK